MSDAAQLKVKVSTEGVKTSKAQLDSMGKKVDDVSSKIGGALKFAAVGAGVAIVGLGVASAKMASDFQSGMTSLVTGAGELEKNIGLVSQGVLKMAVDTGTSTEQLTSGMYMIESAGFHGADGLKVLQAAAEGAKVGSADLGTVANGVTTIMVDYAKQHVSAAQATNMLVATVASGKTHMQDLAQALSTIAPTAAAVGLHVNDMNAAMATMTGEGTDAASAATYLRQMLISFETPGSAAVKTLSDIGLTAKDVSDGMKKSLPDTLQMIEDHLAKKFPAGSAQYVDAIKNIAGGSKQMQGMLELTGTHLDTLKGNLANITDAVNKGGTAITGWAKVQGDFNFTLDKGKELLQTTAITVGTALLPALGDLLNKNIIPLVGRFQDWMTKGGGLQDFQNWIKNASYLLQNQLIPAFTTLLNQDVMPLAQWVGSLWTDAVNLFQAFQQGQPYAVALGVALGTIGSAIAMIKIEEFGAGLANTFATLSQGNGIIANIASEALPNLGKALQWTTVQAEATSTAMKGIGVASEETEAVVVASSAAETLAMGAATAGISLLVGGTIAAIALAASQGQQTMSQATKQANDSLGQTAADIQAKQQAAAAETDVSWKASANDATSRWQSGGEQIAKATADTKAQGIINAQKLADAYIKAAAEADAAWVKASNDMNLSELLKGSGWSDSQIAKYTGQNVTGDSGTSLSSHSTFKNWKGQTVSNSVHVSAHASGIVNSPTGHMASLAEQGDEWMHIPNPTVGYVPQGASVLPHGMSPSSLGGGGGTSSQPIILMMDNQVVARGLLPAIVDRIRYDTGVRGL